LDALARGLRGHGVQVHAVDCDVTEPGSGVFLAAAVAERALEVSVLCDNAGAAYGVAVTALCPGMMPTDLMQHAGLTEALQSMPSFVLDDHHAVAEHGIRALERNRRVTLPSARDRSTVAGLRRLPHRVALELLQRWPLLSRRGNGSITDGTQGAAAAARPTLRPGT
jgi:short-subunit dehydrogenase